MLISVVGYKAEGLRDGFTMMAPTFDAIDGTGKIDLMSLKTGGDYSSGDILVETLTTLGKADKMYEYVKNRSGKWFWRDADTSETINEGDVTFTYGAGLWVQGVDASTLTVAGQVSTADRPIPLTAGFIATGNMMPVPVDLTAIIPGGEYSSGDILIETLTALGKADKMYEFVKNRSGKWFWRDADTSETIEEDDVIFAPGQGLWVQGVDGATITFPGPTL